MVEQRNPFNLPSYWSDDVNGNRTLRKEVLRPKSNITNADYAYADTFAGQGSVIPIAFPISF